MSDSHDSITLQLINKIMHSQPLKDKQIKDLALQGTIDYFACCLQASNHAETRKLIQWIDQEGGKPKVWLIGQKQSATARQAAIFNGFQAHFLDYDDVHAQVRGHPSAVILSALLSSINDTHVSGEQFLSAYVVGIELMAHLGQAIGQSHYQKGWHNTSTLGGIAATAAICHLHGYSFVKDGLAIAATQASGLRLLFGSSIKPLHAGIAAQVAVQACQWADLGIGADCDFLDPKKGFLAVYGDGNKALDIQHWGKPWRIADPGLWFKTYSYCSAASYIADAALALRKRYPFSIDDIARIELVFSQKGDEALIYRQVKMHEQGRFSGEYIVASILLGRKLTFNTFTHHAIDLELQTLMHKVERQYDEHATTRFASVHVKLNNGDILSQSVTSPKGSPHNPYPSSELKNKFIDAVGSKHKANKCYDLLLMLAGHTPVNQIIQSLKAELENDI